MRKVKTERLQQLEVGYQRVNLTTGEKVGELAEVEDRVHVVQLIGKTGPDLAWNLKAAPIIARIRSALMVAESDEC